jgi:hypothetical protein
VTSSQSLNDLGKSGETLSSRHAGKGLLKRNRPSASEDRDVTPSEELASTPTSKKSIQASSIEAIPPLKAHARVPRAAARKAATDLAADMEDLNHFNADMARAKNDVRYLNSYEHHGAHRGSEHTLEPKKKQRQIITHVEVLFNVRRFSPTKIDLNNLLKGRDDGWKYTLYQLPPADVNFTQPNLFCSCGRC